VDSRISTPGVILTLLAAFLQAPFSHVHEHVSTQHHSGGLFHTHTHVRVHSSGQAELRDLDPNDDAVFQQWFSAAPHTPQLLTIVLSVVPVLSVPVANEWRSEAIRPSGHDPPTLATLPPRSPPI
jgi:hypothetical protein